MKKTAFYLLTVAVLAVVLTAGCAKKPAPTTAPETAPAEAEAVTETEMAPQEVSGVEEQEVTEEAMAAEEEVPAGLQRVFFEFDQYTLTEEARATLKENAAYIEAHPEAEIRIEGHCDERGSDEYNLALGERRARAAKNFLVSLGISQDRLSIISYGEERPLDPAHDEAAWAKNRRAEFKILN